MRATEKVAVIGAGAAGLAAARQIALEGFGPVIFEAAARLGGTWVYTEELESDPLSRNPDWHHVHTSMYADLRTNLPRDLMAFPTDPSHLSGTPVSLFSLFRTWPSV
jgi:cation diffusion facilitator CzcD-associated flavoprotein CzcO